MSDTNDPNSFDLGQEILKQNSADLSNAAPGAPTNAPAATPVERSFLKKLWANKKMLTAGVLGVFAAAAIIYVVAFYGQGSEFKGSFFGTPGGMPGATAGLKGTIAGLDIKMLDFSIEENAMLMPVNSTENPVFLAEVNDQFTHGSSACSGAIGGAKCVRMLKKGVNSTLLPPDEGVNCDLNMSQYNEASYYGVCLNENYKENKLDWYLSFLGTCGWGFDLTSCLTGKADSVFEKIKENTTIAADAFCHSSGKSGKFSEIDSDYPDYTFDSVLTSVFFNYMTPEAERPANFTKFVDSIMGGLKESKYCSFHYTKEEMSNFNKYCPNGYYYDSGTTTCAPIMIEGVGGVTQVGAIVLNVLLKIKGILTGCQAAIQLNYEPNNLGFKLTEYTKTMLKEEAKPACATWCPKFGEKVKNGSCKFDCDQANLDFTMNKAVCEGKIKQNLNNGECLYEVIEGYAQFASNACMIDGKSLSNKDVCLYTATLTKIIYSVAKTGTIFSTNELGKKINTILTGFNCCEIPEIQALKNESINPSDPSSYKPYEWVCQEPVEDGCNVITDTGCATGEYCQDKGGGTGAQCYKGISMTCADASECKKDTVCEEKTGNPNYTGLRCWGVGGQPCEGSDPDFVCADKYKCKNSVCTLKFCGDNDPYDKPIQKGKIVLGTGADTVDIYDKCVDTSTVKEYGCDNKLNLTETDVPCPAGTTCVEGTGYCAVEEEEKPTCEGPKYADYIPDPYEAETVILDGESYPDECVSETAIKKFSCNPNDTIASEEIKCAEGEVCKKGICVAQVTEVDCKALETLISSAYESAVTAQTTDAKTFEGAVAAFEKLVEDNLSEIEYCKISAEKYDISTLALKLTCTDEKPHASGFCDCPADKEEILLGEGELATWTEINFIKGVDYYECFDCNGTNTSLQTLYNKIKSAQTKSVDAVKTAKDAFKTEWVKLTEAQKTVCSELKKFADYNTFAYIEDVDEQCVEINLTIDDQIALIDTQLDKEITAEYTITDFAADLVDAYYYMKDLEEDLKAIEGCVLDSDIIDYLPYTCTQYKTNLDQYKGYLDNPTTIPTGTIKEDVKDTLKLFIEMYLYDSVMYGNECTFDITKYQEKQFTCKEFEAKVKELADKMDALEKGTLTPDKPKEAFENAQTELKTLWATYTAYLAEKPSNAKCSVTLYESYKTKKYTPVVQVTCADYQKQLVAAEKELASATTEAAWVAAHNKITTTLTLAQAMTGCDVLVYKKYVGMAWLNCSDTYDDKFAFYEINIQSATSPAVLKIYLNKLGETITEAELNGCKVPASTKAMLAYVYEETADCSIYNQEFAILSQYIGQSRTAEEMAAYQLALQERMADAEVNGCRPPVQLVGLLAAQFGGQSAAVMSALEQVTQLASAAPQVQTAPQIQYVQQQQQQPAQSMGIGQPIPAVMPGQYYAAIPANTGPETYVYLILLAGTAVAAFVTRKKYNSNK